MTDRTQTFVDALVVIQNRLGELDAMINDMKRVTVESPESFLTEGLVPGRVIGPIPFPVPVPSNPHPGTCHAIWTDLGTDRSVAAAAVGLEKGLRSCADLTNAISRQAREGMG